MAVQKLVVANQLADTRTDKSMSKTWDSQVRTGLGCKPCSAAVLRQA